MSAPAKPIGDDEIRRDIAPRFSRTLAAQTGRVYLANHSLGRPLDATRDDVAEALDLWTAKLGEAWDEWGAEMDAYRARLAALLGAPRADCVVPKTSAGQGLRAVLNALDGKPKVVATRGEFDSLDLILREYARRGRIDLSLADAREDGMFDAGAVLGAIGPGTSLVVVSQVMFQTGQVLPGLADIVAQAHRVGARLLLDVYHALGVFPIDVRALDVDFAVGGSYKYLRGGPGACFLYVAPRVLDSGLRSLDTGWFAKETPFAYRRPDPPRYGPGGDAWLESTPAVLPIYQARAGQVFTAAIGVARLRAHSLALQRELVALLAAEGIAAEGGREDRGAFIVVRDRHAGALADALTAQQVITDARGQWLRLCPDVLTTRDELARAASALGAIVRRRSG